MTVLEIEAHGRRARMERQPGKIGKCWAAGKPYEAPLLEHIYRQQFGGLAVDAGANFGNHTIWMAAMCGLQVAAFEPLQHAILARNVALNGLDDGRVEVHPVALGAADGHAETVGKGKLDVGVGTIPVRTLDSYQLADVAVIKADVEDMEPDLLRGGEQTIRRDRPVIYAEAHDGQHDLLADVLEPWGYRHVGSHNAKESVTPVEEWRWRP